MRPQQVLLVTLAVLAVLAALPLITEAAGSEEENASKWPCCNQCGFCNRKNPPECNCLDISYGGCDPKCVNCVEYIPSGSTQEGPIYRCADVLTNYCKRRCTPTAAAAFV